MTYAPAFAAVWPIVYWIVVLIIVAVAVAAAANTLRTPRRSLVVTSGVALAVAIALVVAPHPHTFIVVNLLLGLAALALSVIGGGPTVMFVLALASRGSVREGVHGGIIVATQDQAAAPAGAPHEVLRGGTTIGFFERFATTATIMAGIPEAVAVVVAIKSVGRFTELDTAETRERFIIGTLVSLVWAGACGGLFRFAVAG